MPKLDFSDFWTNSNGQLVVAGQAIPGTLKPQFGSRVRISEGKETLVFGFAGKKWYLLGQVREVQVETRAKYA